MSLVIPHQYTPRQYQLEYLQTLKRFKICVWNRRAGKSKTALNEQIRKACLNKGIYYYFLPTYRQAKAVIWDSLLNEHLPQGIYLNRNSSELCVYYNNGSIQRFVGCEDIDKHRGINPIDVVFDEYSEMKEEIWTTIIQPVLRENRGTATFIFTPKGRNHAWKLLQLAKDSDDWFISLKNNTDTLSIEDDEIEKMKHEMPSDLFQQEIMCSFLDNAGAFFRRIDENLHSEEVEDNDWQIGVDLAKYKDWTVLTPFGLNSFKAARQDRFNQIDYNLQKARIEAMYFRYKKNDSSRTKIVIDSTGVGEPVYDDLVQRNLRIEPFHFTQESRTQLLRNLQILLEQDKIKIFNDEELVNELKSFQYCMGERGKVSIKVPDNMADDRVMSLALSVWNVKTPIWSDGNSYEQAAQKFSDYQSGRPKPIIPGAQTPQEWRDYQRRATAFMD